MEKERIWPSRAEATILQLLIGEPSGMYGLQLVTASNGALKRGTAYVTLGRMVDKGFLKVVDEKVESGYPGLPRKSYRLTGFGRKVLDSVGLFGASIQKA